MASRVWEVLLKTSAPSGSSEPTSSRAPLPESDTKAVTPLFSRAWATDSMSSSEASSENSADASSVTWTTAGGSVTVDLSQSAVHQGHCHRTLTDGRGAALDRSLAHVT